MWDNTLTGCQNNREMFYFYETNKPEFVTSLPSRCEGLSQVSCYCYCLIQPVLMIKREMVRQRISVDCLQSRVKTQECKTDLYTNVFLICA